ncbi:Uncharacterised protein g2307 [Pycnogonum litorale]
MDFRNISFLLVSILICYQPSESQMCLRCDQYSCFQKMPKCLGSVVSDPRTCGCCERCAKQLDEPCGGIWKMRGVCEKGLVCGNEKGKIGGICRPPINVSYN